MKTTVILSVMVLLFSAGRAQQPTAFPTYVPMDSITFEVNTLPFQIIPVMSNIWQVGVPQKTLFNAAFSVPNALVTDLVNPYAAVSYSAFQFRMPLVYEMGGGWIYPATFLAFRHNYDTDTLADYCSVEVSYDAGISWQPLDDTIITDTQYGPIHFCGWVSPLGSSPHYQTSGSSGGWKLSIYGWQWMITVKDQHHLTQLLPDSIDIRFIFQSDQNHNPKEGWMIDDIITGWNDVGGGMGETPDLAWRISPNPATDYILLENPMHNQADRAVIMDVGGRIVQQEALTGESKNRITVNGLKSGVYFCRIMDRGRVVEVLKFTILE